MIIYRCLTIHQQWKKFVALLRKFYILEYILSPFLVLPLFPLVGMPVYSVLTVSSFMPSNSNLKYSSSL